MRDRIETHRGFRYVMLKSGRRVSFMESLAELDGALSGVYLWMARSFRTAEVEDRDVTEQNLEFIERRVEQAEDWLRAIRAELVRQRGRQDLRQRIAALRNVSGRTPEEAAAYLARASALETELER
jgi:hypothetical protein